MEKHSSSSTSIDPAGRSPHALAVASREVARSNGERANLGVGYFFLPPFFFLSLSFLSFFFAIVVHLPFIWHTC